MTCVTRLQVPDYGECVYQASALALNQNVDRDVVDGGQLRVDLAHQNRVDPSFLAEEGIVGDDAVERYIEGQLSRTAWGGNIEVREV